MNKTEYTKFIKQLIDNLHDVLVCPDTATDVDSKLDQIKKAVTERLEWLGYIFAALNPKSDVNVKFPYVLYAIFYALRGFDCGAVLNKLNPQCIDTLKSCVVERENLPVPVLIESKVNNETFQKAHAITNMLGTFWPDVKSTFDKWATEIKTIHQKNKEDQRPKRGYSHNTMEIEELVDVLYPGTDKTIEQKTEKFLRATECAPANWFVTEDGVKKIYRRYYYKLCVFLGVIKESPVDQVCSMDELATTLYPDDVDARQRLMYRIEYYRNKAPLSIADLTQLTRFFASDECGNLAFRKGREKEFLNFLNSFSQNTKKVAPENTITFKELTDLVYYDEEESKRVDKLYNRKTYVMQLLKRANKKTAKEVESWFVPIWGGKCFKKEYYVKFFHLMRPNDSIPQEQLALLGITDYVAPKRPVVKPQKDDFAGVPDIIDHDMDADELAQTLYPGRTPKGARSHYDKYKSWLMAEYEDVKGYEDTIYNIKNVWFYGVGKGTKLYLHKEYFKDFKDFMALPLRTRHEKTYVERKAAKQPVERAIQIDFGDGLLGVKALEQYLQTVQVWMLEITQARNNALASKKQYMDKVFAAKGKAKDIVKFITAAQKEQITMDSCDALVNGTTEANNLLKDAAQKDINDAVAKFFACQQEHIDLFKKLVVESHRMQ